MIGLTVRRIVSLVAICVAFMLLASPAALAGEAPVKEILTSQIGLEVDMTSGADICILNPVKDSCQPGKRGSQPGAFDHPDQVAGAPDGAVYVADAGNHRIQELTATGGFISMFGWDVNKGKLAAALKGAVVSQAERNVCDAEEECQAGVEGGAPGQFGERLEGLAVDPMSGDVYVADVIVSSGGERERVQKFTSAGRFVLEIGKEVNQTKTEEVNSKGGTPTQKELEEENLCKAEEEAKGVKCASPGLRGEVSVSSVIPGAFMQIGALAAGGPEDDLYVGEKNGVQAFGPEGEPVHEPAEAITSRLRTISSNISSQVSGIAVDNSCLLHRPAPLTESTVPTCNEFDASYGDLFLTYNEAGSPTDIIRKFESNGKETELAIHPRNEGASVFVQQFAIDQAGRLGVNEEEIDSSFSLTKRGVLYAVGAASLRRITEFTILNYTGYFGSGITFNGEGDMYIVSQQPGNEVASYFPVPVGELVTEAGVLPCREGAEQGTDVTVQCTLSGHVDPWGVPGTVVWFEWGASPLLGDSSPPQMIPVVKGEGEEEPATGVSAVAEGLTPNEPLYYQLAGEDRNVKAPELLTSEKELTRTPSVPPRIVGAPEVQYVHSTTAVMFGRLNPENSQTKYAFQYAPAETCASLEQGCSETMETKTLGAPDYGTIATTLEAVGLRPNTTYRYRLFASNEKREEAHDEKGGPNVPEGTFITAVAPAPLASTGGYGFVTATSATISGTVNPDGQPATYAFELGVNRGASTQFGTVSSGPAGSSDTPVERQLTLTGLQPGTEYAYRIKISSGYGTAYGSTNTFATAGVPSLIPAAEMPSTLAVPPFPFPASVPKCKHGYRHNRHGKCVKVSSKAKSHRKHTKHKKRRS